MKARSAPRPPEPAEDVQQAVTLRLYRVLLLVGGAVFIAFGPLYRLAEPGLVDPLGVRLGVGLAASGIAVAMSQPPPPTS